MSGDLVVKLIADHGPWVILVFFLLWRDAEKDRATRAVLDKNAAILTEIATVIRERMPSAALDAAGTWDGVWLGRCFERYGVVVVVQYV